MTIKGYEKRVKKVLNGAMFTPYGDPIAMEITRNNGLLAYQICIMEDILDELVDFREAGYGRYIDEEL